MLPRSMLSQRGKAETSGGSSMPWPLAAICSTLASFVSSNPSHQPQAQQAQTFPSSQRWAAMATGSGSKGALPSFEDQAHGHIGRVNGRAHKWPAASSHSPGCPPPDAVPARNLSLAFACRP